MKLHQLTKTTTRSQKRRGRGYGSGVGGHTVGRGAKGQKARSNVSLWFEGGQLPLTKRLPFWRGKSRFARYCELRGDAGNLGAPEDTGAWKARD